MAARKAPAKKKAATRRRPPRRRCRAKKKAAAERLEKYQSMRDFSKTAEPSGATEPPDPGPGQPLRGAAPPGPRPALRPAPRDGRRAGQLGRAEGPDARPEGPPPRGPRGGPPARLLRLRGRDPERRVRRRRRDRVGLGHVELGQGGPGRSGAGGRGRRAPLRPRTARSWPAASCSCAPTRAATSSGCCCTSTTTTPSPGWDAGRPPRVGEVGPHQRRGEGGAAGHLDPGPSPRGDPPTDDELAALDELGKAGEWELQGRELKLTNLDKVLFPGRDGEEPLTKRDLVRYHALIAPWMLPYLAGRPLNTNRFPDGVDKKGFWSKAQPKHAPDWLPAWHYDDHGEGRDRVVHGRRQRRRRSRGWPTTARSSCTRGPRRSTRRTSRRGPSSTSIPARRTAWDDVVLLAGLYRAALDHLGVRRRPEGDRQAGHPDLGAGARRGTRSTTPGTGWKAISRAIGSTVPDLVSWAWTKSGPRRQGPPRLHAERHQQDAGRAVQRPPGPGCAGVGADRPGTSSTTPISPPTAGRSAPSSTASTTPATPCRPWSASSRSSPSSPDPETDGGSPVTSGT